MRAITPFERKRKRLLAPNPLSLPQPVDADCVPAHLSKTIFASHWAVFTRALRACSCNVCITLHRLQLQGGNDRATNASVNSGSFVEKTKVAQVAKLLLTSIRRADLVFINNLPDIQFRLGVYLGITGGVLRNPHDVRKDPPSSCHINRFIWITARFSDDTSTTNTPSIANRTGLW